MNRLVATLCMFQTVTPPFYSRFGQVQAEFCWQGKIFGIAPHGLWFSHMEVICSCRLESYAAADLKSTRARDSDVQTTP